MWAILLFLFIKYYNIFLDIMFSNRHSLLFSIENSTFIENIVFSRILFLEKCAFIKIVNCKIKMKEIDNLELMTGGFSKFSNTLNIFIKNIIFFSSFSSKITIGFVISDQYDEIQNLIPNFNYNISTNVIKN